MRLGSLLALIIALAIPHAFLGNAKKENSR
jgi:hypothetical protein